MLSKFAKSTRNSSAEWMLKRFGKMSQLDINQNMAILNSLKNKGVSISTISALWDPDLSPNHKRDIIATMPEHVQEDAKKSLNNFYTYMKVSKSTAKDLRDGAKIGLVAGTAGTLGSLAAIKHVKKNMLNKEIQGEPEVTEDTSQEQEYKPAAQEVIEQTVENFSNRLN